MGMKKVVLCVNILVSLWLNRSKVIKILDTMLMIKDDVIDSIGDREITKEEMDKLLKDFRMLSIDFNYMRPIIEEWRDLHKD